MRTDSLAKSTKDLMTTLTMVNIKAILPDKQTAEALLPSQVSVMIPTRPATPESKTSKSEPSTLPNALPTKPLNVVFTSQTLRVRSSPPFQALLIKPPPPFPSYLGNESKLVSLHVGGKIMTTSAAAIISQKSHLADFVADITGAEPKADHILAQSPIISTSSAPSAYSQFSEPNSNDPKVISKQEAFSVTLHLPSSPMMALHSARASVFDEVPSDEEEHHEKWENNGLHLGVPSALSPFRRTCASSGSGNLSFLDTTPDEEMDDPFHYSKPESASTSSQPPSLSSSPTSSDFINVKSITGGAQLPTRRALEIIARSCTASHRSIEIYLDRPSEPYELILYYLREGELPRRLRYSSSAAMFTVNDSDHDPNSALTKLVRSVPVGLRHCIIPFLLHPIVSQLQDLLDEAAYLGMTELEDLCAKELAQLKNLTADAVSTVPLNQQRLKGKSRSPVRRNIDGVSRPRMGTHPPFESEASVAKLSIVDGNGWI